MPIAITGASGSLGRLTADLLLETVDPADLVLVTRDPDGLADLAARGVAVRAGDFTRPDTLGPAFAGVERLLIISGDVLEGRLGHHRAAVAAATDAGVERVVYTSVPRPEGNPALVAPSHLGTEAALRDSGMRWTALRNNLYAHMQAATIQQAIASGQLVTNAGDGAVAYVAREDCAAVAAAALVQDGHEDRAYDVTGPEAVTAADLAALASELGGREVEVVAVDDAALAEGLAAAGLPAGVVEVIVSIGRATREGFFGEVAPTVAELTGQAPRGLREVVTATLADA